MNGVEIVTAASSATAPDETRGNVLVSGHMAASTMPGMRSPWRTRGYPQRRGYRQKWRRHFRPGVAGPPRRRGRGHRLLDLPYRRRRAHAGPWPHQPCEPARGSTWLQHRAERCRLRRTHEGRASSERRLARDRGRQALRHFGQARRQARAWARCRAAAGAGDAGAIAVTGSHAALFRGRPDNVISVDLFAVFFNDAGVGLDNAGIRRLADLENRGIIAATVSAESAEIGSARSSYDDGIVSHSNRLRSRPALNRARACGWWWTASPSAVSATPAYWQPRLCESVIPALLSQGIHASDMVKTPASASAQSLASHSRQWQG